MKKSSISKKLNPIKKMPPMYHTVPGSEFDIKKSVVVNWLIRQPDILNYLWDQIRNSGYMKYDPETGMWQGVDYNGD